MTDPLHIYHHNALRHSSAQVMFISLGPGVSGYIPIREIRRVISRKVSRAGNILVYLKTRIYCHSLSNQLHYSYYDNSKSSLTVFDVSILVRQGMFVGGRWACASGEDVMG